MSDRLPHPRPAVHLCGGGGGGAWPIDDRGLLTTYCTEYVATAEQQPSFIVSTEIAMPLIACPIFCSRVKVKVDVKVKNRFLMGVRVLACSLQC